MDVIRDIARRVSNWGRWGADDERGTVNFITPEVIRRGAACVKRGVVFSLALPFAGDGLQFGQGGRINPVHLMTSLQNQLGADPEGPRYSDDVIMMPLQCATQWDSSPASADARGARRRRRARQRAEPALPASFGGARVRPGRVLQRREIQPQGQEDDVGVAEHMQVLLAEAMIHVDHDVRERCAGEVDRPPATCV